jgi:hypothetical protein
MGALFMAATCTITNTRMTTIDGHDVFAGELQNDSGINILNHKIRVAFLDSSNNLVETKTVDPCVRSVKNGESNYFSAKATASDSTTTAALSRMANLAEDPTFKVGDQADSDIDIPTLSIRRDGDNLRITGTVKNLSDSKLYSPNVCAVVFDDDGNVLIVQIDTSLNDLSKNSSDGFDINIDLTDIDGISTAVKTVDIAVDGLDGSSSGTPVKPHWDRDNSVTVCGTPTNTPTKTNTPANTATNTPIPAGTDTATPTDTATATPTGTPNTNTPTATSTACAS